MRIGFFGGSFNPPSNVHINLAENILKKYKLNKIVFVPVGDYYNKKDLVRGKDRFNMLKLATKGNKDFEIEDITLNTKNKLYAIDTFKLLNEKYKADDLFFIMGSDNFRKMPTWKDYDELINDYNIIVVERERSIVRHQIRKNIYEFIPEEFSETDSTKIRKMIKKGEEVKHLLNEEVYKYIKENKLYLN